MTVSTIGRSDVLAEIDRQREWWEGLLAEVGEERMERPGAAGDWTFKDVVAHLNGWRRRTVARLEAAASDGHPPTQPWPAELDDDTDEGVDAINAWLYARDRDRGAAEIVAESRELFRRMRDAVEAIAEADLTTPGRFAWLGGYPLSAVLDGAFEHFHDEHEPDIRAWLQNQDRAGAGATTG